ncbi:hypothetical protein [Dactylosporangium sp. CA-139066]|uniref:hypothetical protein n=1 Tax=Dactylosporangium sp. CA-139066 TaxID=3239930 RepID=UPI003D8C2F2B
MPIDGRARQDRARRTVGAITLCTSSITYLAVGKDTTRAAAAPANANHGDRGGNGEVLMLDIAKRTVDIRVETTEPSRTTSRTTRSRSTA